MKIAIIAPPWLRTFPGCYYGIENVIQGLVSSLHRRGHEVVLFGVGGSTTECSKLYYYHDIEQYGNIHRAWYEAIPVISSHILYSLNIIVNHGDFDIIHDHNSFVGPAMMAFAYGNLPPVLHTLHEPFTDPRLVDRNIPDNRLLFQELKHAQGMYFNGISDSQLSTAPKDLDSKILEIIPNGVDLDEYTFSKKKSDYFLNVGRISHDKGQADAARFCSELGVPFKCAGTIGGGISDYKTAEAEVKKPTDLSDGNPYFSYYRDELRPHLKQGEIEYLGTVFGQKKMKLIARAKGFLAPIHWEEPFGISLIDALASGTPVVAYRRGAFPEIIEHGRNGFLADNEKEFKEYIARVDEIDPEECRKSVEENFSSDKMAERYEALYERVIQTHKTRQKIKI